jgi:hypothetical protein
MGLEGRTRMRGSLCTRGVEKEPQAGGRRAGTGAGGACGRPARRRVARSAARPRPDAASGGPPGRAGRDAPRPPRRLRRRAPLDRADRDASGGGARLRRRRRPFAWDGRGVLGPARRLAGAGGRDRPQPEGAQDRRDSLPQVPLSRSRRDRPPGRNAVHDADADVGRPGRHPRHRFAATSGRAGSGAEAAGPRRTGRGAAEGQGPARGESASDGLRGMADRGRGGAGPPERLRGTRGCHDFWRLGCPGRFATRRCRSTERDLRSTSCGSAGVSSSKPTGNGRTAPRWPFSETAGATSSSWPPDTASSGSPGGRCGTNLATSSPGSPACWSSQAPEPEQAGECRSRRSQTVAPGRSPA